MSGGNHSSEARLIVNIQVLRYMNFVLKWHMKFGSGWSYHIFLFGVYAWTYNLISARFNNWPSLVSS